MHPRHVPPVTRRWWLLLLLSFYFLIFVVFRVIVRTCTLCVCENGDTTNPVTLVPGNPRACSCFKTSAASTSEKAPIPHDNLFWPPWASLSDTSKYGIFLACLAHCQVGDLIGPSLEITASTKNHWNAHVSPRHLPLFPYRFDYNNKTAVCHTLWRSGIRLHGSPNGGECWCGSSGELDRHRQYGPGTCDIPCPKGPKGTCGTCIAPIFNAFTEPIDQPRRLAPEMFSHCLLHRRHRT